MKNLYTFFCYGCAYTICHNLLYKYFFFTFALLASSSFKAINFAEFYHLVFELFFFLIVDYFT